MSYSIIENPPKNFVDYVKVPGTDCREQFIKSLSGLFKQTPFIYTESIPIGWAMDAVKFSKDGKHYSTKMQRVPVNFGEPGTAHGIFYFERQPEKKPN
jgi:hypothetical protein